VQDDVHDFAFAAWSQFEELLATTPDGVRIRVLYPPGYRHTAELERDLSAWGLAFFGKAFGRYPYGTLTIVHPPAGAEEAGGMEYPTLITTGGSGVLMDVGARFVETVTIHELGHQWFYGLLATDEHNHPFLDEGVNSFAEEQAMTALYGFGSALSVADLSVGLAPLARLGSVDAAKNGAVDRPTTGFATGGDYAALVYYRTATVLDTLARVYGEDRMMLALGRYARRYRFEHPGPKELFDAVGEVLGTDAEDQLYKAIEQAGTVDYSVGDLWSAPEAGGYHGEVLVRRSGTLKFPVDVDLVAKDGSVEHRVWDAQAAFARLPYHGRSPLVAAIIDPDHRVLLDDDFRNNARRTSPSRVSGALLERFAFAFQAAFSVLLP
jgi:aminopeptidase N